MRNREERRDDSLAIMGKQRENGRNYRRSCRTKDGGICKDSEKVKRGIEGYDR